MAKSKNTGAHTAGIFTIIAALIAGAFLLLNTVLEHNLSLPTPTFSPSPAFIPSQTPEPSHIIESSSETPTLLSPQELRDRILGIVRLDFRPAFSTKPGIQISHMAANESDLYLLDSVKGSVIRSVAIGESGYEVDTTFDCKPGIYGDRLVGSLVDILVLPKGNALNASILGIDSAGNLLYCAPGQMPKAFSLTPPSTNWGQITSMVLDNDKLYVIDPSARAIWIYTGKDVFFMDAPYFFFGNQIPEISDAIDFAVKGDDLIILHQDGSFSYCSYSRIDSISTRCENLLTQNHFPAYDDPGLFAKAQIAQMVFAPAPDFSLFLLDVTSKGVLRISLNDMEIQAQYRSVSGQESPFSSGSISAMAVSPDRVLFLAVEGQIYFSSEVP